MKFITKTFLLTSLLLFSTNLSNAITFEEAYNNSYRKPFVTLVYADWADNYESCLDSFYKSKKRFGNVFNFVELDIASKDAKFFNSKFQINPRLPYVMIQRENGKITRYVQKDCVIDESCLNTKIKSFIQ